MHTGFRWGNLKERELEDLVVDGKSANWISSSLYKGQRAESCRHGNKTSGFVKYWEFPLLIGKILGSQKAFCSMEVVS